MPVQSKIEACCETVIAALADRIESLQDELRWKDMRLEDLTKANIALRARLGDEEPPKRPSDMLFHPADLFDPADDCDPFEGGSEA